MVGAWPVWQKIRSLNPGRWLPLRDALWPIFHKPAPELQVDAELELRSLRWEDTPRLFQLIESNRSHLQTWLSWVNKVRSVDDTRSFMHYLDYRDIFSGRWVYGIWYKEDMVGLMDFNEGEREFMQVSIGYWLSREHQGKGIITRCVKRALDYAFEEHRLRKVLIKCATGNLRSQAVPLRLHFAWEGIEHESGTLHGEPVNMMIYAMRYHDWKELREEGSVSP